MKKILLISFVGLLVFLVSCTVSTEKQCSVDSDCIAAQCCHATDAVNKENAPDCSGQLCTMNCEPNTLDCGQGNIRCVSGSCDVLLK